MTETNVVNLPVKTNFWDSVFGKILRWTSFIPVGAVLLLIIELLSLSFFVWLFQDFRGFVIIGVVFGGFFTFLPAIVMSYFGSIYLITKIICPAPKLGVPIFGTLYLIGNLLNCFSLIYQGSWGMLFYKFVFIIIAVVTFIMVYSEDT